MSFIVRVICDSITHKDGDCMNQAEFKVDRFNYCKSHIPQNVPGTDVIPITGWRLYTSVHDTNPTEIDLQSYLKQ
jgi:hypothetical protein